MPLPCRLLLSLVLICAVLVAVPAVAHAAPAVTLGVDVLLAEHKALVDGKRVGLCVNAAAVDSELVPTLERLQAAGVNVVQLWAPEHGLGGALPNGRSGPSGVDPASGLPVEGLFGKRTAPSPESLARVDVVLFDLQDVGSRTYTYATTLGKLMTVAARAKVPVVVLDRPNPQGGLKFEGPIRGKAYKSLIGWGPLPVTHGMTMGELARFYEGELKLGCQVTVVPMRGWQRSMIWEDTGLHWIPSSPGIPHPLNAHLYVATGMVGGSGANVNEGGGNSMPFELIGAPFIDPRKLADELAKAQLPGVRFRPMTFRPWRGQFARKVVHGVQLILTDRQAFRPLRTALAMLTALRKTHPEAFKVNDVRRFARTWGNGELLSAILGGKKWQEIEQGWSQDLAGFAEKRGKYLLYP